MKRNTDFVSRTVAGELILVPIAREAADLESVFTLNEVGARVWDLLDECGSADAIAAKLTEEFEVEQATALADVEELLGQLRDLRAVVDE